MIQIVPMEAKYVPQIAQLEAICFSDPWSENSIGQELTNPLSVWLAAVEDARVAGYIGSQTVMGETDMMNVAVHPEFRRRGVAQALIQSLVEVLKTRHSHCLTLEVRASNVPAINLYEKLGFSQVGKRPGYYRKPKEDAFILRKEWEI